jgi:hypothetical protein
MKTAKVVDVTPILERKKYDRHHRWTPTMQEIDVLVRVLLK